MSISNITSVRAAFATVTTVVVAMMLAACQSGGQPGTAMASASHIKVKNTTGKPASDLHITFRGTGGSLQIDPASVRPRDGTNPPKVPSNNKDNTNEGVIEWSSPIVKDKDEVDFDAATAFGPLEFASGFWTGPTDEGPRKDIGPIKPEDIKITPKK